MDKFIDTRFDRVEKALALLIESITKYHPSLAQANDLVVADEELRQGLGQVQAHQANFLRLQELRAASDALNSQIRDTLAILVATRKEVLAAPVSAVAEGPTYPVSYEELLKYARRISKTTLPPSGIIQGAVLSPEPLSSPSDPMNLQSHAPPASGATLSPVPDRTLPPTSTAAANGWPAAGEADVSNLTIGSINTTLPDFLTQRLNPLTGSVFVPWPSEDRIRSGSLALIQTLLERGVDPRVFDPVAEAERRQRGEQDRAEQEERDRHERDAREQRILAERELLWQEREIQQRERERNGSHVWPNADPASARTVGFAEPGEKKQFQFTSLDDLDDDDD